MTHMSATELLQQLATREISAVELTRRCLDRIERCNGTLNAFVHVASESALQQAAESDRRRLSGEIVGRLEGIPIAVKDNICVRDMPTTCGSQILHNFVPPYDAHVVERMRAEGAIIVGKLNMDEFAMGSSTETATFGPARNPWDMNCTAGGSSGGAAVAVASGMIPLALGSDTGGSIRQPASFCGVVGMKPTYGRVSRYGLVAYASSLDQIGPFATNAVDAALLLDAIAGHDERDSTSLKSKAAPHSGELTGLRVGIVAEHFAEGLSPEVARSVRTAIEVLKSAGAEVREVTLPHSNYAVAAYYLIACSEASSNLARYDGIHFGHRAAEFKDLVDLYCRSRGEGFGAEVKRRILLGTYALSAGYYDAYYLKALKVRRRIKEDFDRAFAEVDVIAGPVAPTAAFRLGEKLNDPLAMYLEDIYTISTNLAGLPGISVPCGFTSAGLPIGLQLQAPELQDGRLIAIAERFQQITDWHLRTPG